MSVNIEHKPFKLDKIIKGFDNNKLQIGAVVSFIGYVRDFSSKKKLNYMFIDHYPGMTEKSLKKIENLARDRWNFCEINITHRVG